MNDSGEFICNMVEEAGKREEEVVQLGDVSTIDIPTLIKDNMTVHNGIKRY